MNNSSLKWVFWLASVVLLLLAVLAAAGVLSLSAPWLFPAGVLALVLALLPVWV